MFSRSQRTEEARKSGYICLSPLTLPPIPSSISPLNWEGGKGVFKEYWGAGPRRRGGKHRQKQPKTHKHMICTS